MTVRLLAHNEIEIKITGMIDSGYILDKCGSARIMLPRNVRVVSQYFAGTKVNPINLRILTSGIQETNTILKRIGR